MPATLVSGTANALLILCSGCKMCKLAFKMRFARHLSSD